MTICIMRLLSNRIQDTALREEFVGAFHMMGNLVQEEGDDDALSHCDAYLSQSASDAAPEVVQIDHLSTNHEGQRCFPYDILLSNACSDRKVHRALRTLLRRTSELQFCSASST